MENKPLRISPVLIKKFAVQMRKLGVTYFKCQDFEIKMSDKDPNDELVDVTNLVEQRIEQKTPQELGIGGFRQSGAGEELFGVSMYRPGVQAIGQNLGQNLNPNMGK